MPLLTVTNLTPSVISIQDPTGVHGISLLVQGSATLANTSVTLEGLASIEPQLIAGTGAGTLSWSVVDDPHTSADLGWPAAAYAASEVHIYARVTGNDATGDGSLEAPFRTLQRAIRSVPSIIPAGRIYHVDITDLGLEVLPDQYEFPVFVASEGVGDFDFDEKYFYYYGAVNITADPKLATGVTGLTTIPLAGSVVSTPTASTNLKAIQHVGAGWTPGELKGKFAISAGLGTEHSVIWDNTADTIFLTRDSAPTFPVQIMECSAELQAGKDPNDLHRAAVNIRNSQIALGGIKVSSTSAAAGPFGAWGLQVAGNMPPASLQLCHLIGAGFNGTSWVRTRQCYLQNQLFYTAPLAITQSFIDGAMEVVPTSGLFVTMWGARGLDSMIKQTVVRKTGPIHMRDLFDTFSSAPVGLLMLQHVQVLDTVVEIPPPGEDLGSMDGILWTGGHLQLWGVDISRTATDPDFNTGTALRVRGNDSQVTMRGVTGTGYLLGASFEDGAVGKIDDVGGGGTATTLTGSSGDQKVGSQAIDVWPAAAYPAAGANLLDYSGSDAQGSRLWRKS